MRIRRSKWSALSLVGLIVIGSLGLGLAVASFSVGNAPGQNIRITTVDDVDATAEPVELAGSDVSTPAVVPSRLPADLSSAEVTPAPIATDQELASNVFLQEQFDSLSPDFPARETATWSVGTVDQRYQFKLNGQTLIGASLALPVENYRLSVDVAVVEGGAGVVFLLSQPDTSYHIILSPDGAYSIERRDNSAVTTIIGWTASPALQRVPGASHRLQVERRGDVFTFSANDQHLADFTAPAGQYERQFGLVLTSRKGVGEASFDNLLGEQLP